VLTNTWFLHFKSRSRHLLPFILRKRNGAIDIMFLLKRLDIYYYGWNWRDYSKYWCHTTKRQPNPIFFFSIFQSDRIVLQIHCIYVVGMCLQVWHQYIVLVIGPDQVIFQDWIIDHKDRNRYFNCRTNLRWLVHSSMHGT
jgi:hypothetical protein